MVQLRCSDGVVILFVCGEVEKIASRQHSGEISSISEKVRDE